MWRFLPCFIIRTPPADDSTFRYLVTTDDETAADIAETMYENEANFKGPGVAITKVNLRAYKKEIETKAYRKGYAAGIAAATSNLKG